MFRKSRKSVVANPTVVSDPQSRRFFQAGGAEEVASGEGATFSVGATQTKPKSPGFLSRLFKRSKEDLKPLVTNNNETQPRRKSLWQRSKSILRPRSVLDRSESAVLDLPTTHLNIRGSGSSAQLLMNEFPVEEFYAKGSAVDTDGLLMRIFEANQVVYEQLKEQERRKDTERQMGAKDVGVGSVNLEGLITPVITATELEQCNTVAEEVTCEAGKGHVFEATAVNATADIVTSEITTEEIVTAEIASEEITTEEITSEKSDIVIPTTEENVTVLSSGSQDYYKITDHHHFTDNAQLDSPLYGDMSLSFSDSSDKDDSLSLESSVRSFLDENFSCEGVDSLSLTEIAEMFDCLQVTEPQTLKDGTVRCTFENENGSMESIRFHNWQLERSVVRATKSEETLKLTEISVAPENKQKVHESIVKQRSMSLATFGKVGGSQEIPVDRRRSLGAKVSQIVAMFEGAHF